MTVISKRQGTAYLLAAAAMLAPLGVAAQEQTADQTDPELVVYGETPADISGLPEGPEVEGFISARNGNIMQVTGADGTGTAISLSEGTEIKSRKGFLGLGRNAVGMDALLNGLPVTVETVRWGGTLVASKIKFRSSDFKTARMIRSGTEQQFDAQGRAIGANTAAADALRSRMGDIDKYNIKSTTNVYFDTGRWNISPEGEAQLCAAAAEAEALDNALLLVVGYTDSVGSQEVNQRLSERRAGRVVNYLQQACGWKPYRMLTPTGMAEADPQASNDTAYGKAQNRRVSVNVLVSKGLDGL